jgi:hypothetical protein
MKVNRHQNTGLRAVYTVVTFCPVEKAHHFVIWPTFPALRVKD